MDLHQMKRAAAEFQTPFYVFDTDELCAKVEKIKTALQGRAKVCYAMKANPFLIDRILPAVDALEVCSPGEFAICERSEIPAGKIVLSGVYKKAADIRSVLESYGGDPVYTVESYSQWQMFAAYTNRMQLSIHVLLRLSNGNQFGMDQSVLEEIVAHRADCPYIHIEGVQYFTGTQKRAASKVSRELKKLDDLVDTLREKYGYETEKLEYGPGLPVSYFDGEEEVGDALLAGLTEALQALRFSGEVVLEMGRYIAAQCGYYFAGVVDTKVNGAQPYCLINGGIHQVNYYGQMMAMKHPPIVHLQPRGEEETAWTICGSLCTVSDVLVKQYPFHGLQTGDTLVFEKTGAYSVTEGIALFLSRDLPAVLLYSEKDGYQIARDHIAVDKYNSFH